MKETLLDIQIRREKLLTLILENQGEITPEIEQEVLAIDFAQSSKVENYVHVIERLKHETQFWKDKKEKLTGVLKRLENTTDFLETRLKDFMISNGFKCISGTETKITCYDSKPRVIIKDDLKPTDMPIEYVRTKLEIDKEAIRKDLEQGKQLSFAYLEKTKALRLTPQVPHSRWLADKP